MKTVSWKIKDGRTATVTISIDKNLREIEFGGKVVEVVEGRMSTWSINYSATVEGMGELNALGNPVEDAPAPFAGKLGKLGFSAEIREQIEAAVAEVKASDDWQRKVASERANDAAAREYDSAKARIENAMAR